MLRFGPSKQLLSRYSTGWLAMGVAPVRTGSPLYQSIWQVSTTPPNKAQATKEQVKVAKNTVKEAVEKKAKSTRAAAAKPRQASTKATASISSEKSSTAAKAVKPAPKTGASKAKTAATSGEEAEAAALTPVEKTPAAKASTAAAAATRAAEAAAATPAAKAPGQATSSHTPTPASTPRPMASNTMPETTPSPAVSTESANSSPGSTSPLPYAAHVPTPAESEPKRPVDPSSPEYKQAARKWVQAIVALPILLVTSYFLYDRLALGNHRSLEAYRTRPQPAAVASEGVEAHKV